MIKRQRRKTRKEKKGKRKTNLIELKEKKA